MRLTARPGAVPAASRKNGNPGQERPLIIASRTSYRWLSWTGPSRQASFTPERIRDPALSQLMGKIRVAEDPDFTERYPEAQASRMEVVNRSGRRFVACADYPKGHWKRPLTDEELEDKFNSLAREVLSAQQRRAAVEALWALEEVDDIGRVLDHFRADRDIIR